MTRIQAMPRTQILVVENEAPAALDIRERLSRLGYQIAGIAVSATVVALATASAVNRVIFCCFSRDSATLHEQALEGFGSPCPD